MLNCIYKEDNSICTTTDYENSPDKYRGLIYCIECGAKAWFTKGYETQKINRMACFGAKHKDGCNASTVEFISDDHEVNEGDESNQNSDIRVDLDKASTQSIYVSNDNNKHGDDESEWKGKSKKRAIGNSDGFPLGKSLRQLLTNLCRNTDYAEDDQTITIVANSGRIVLEGELKQNLVKIENVTKKHIGKDYIFWGKVNNLSTDKNGDLWLNYGDYRTEPSIALNSRLKEELLTNFKLKDVSELDGSDIIIVGHVGFSPQGKAIIKTGFTKYMSFRRIRVA
ncbi:hypothetical protein [Pseudoalteromonas sp. Ld20]|uniref:hypothetical protein n=1 Tax=Pseudoalteromonas sp. Ld20 TaxID=649165 RepID=UPI00386DACD1